MNPIPGQANIRALAVVAKADGSAITSGTVTYYLQAQTGANAGKWFKTADDSWAANEEAAGAMSHVARGRWSVSVDAAAWIDGVEYLEYAAESGALDVPTVRQCRAEYPADLKRVLGTALTETGAGYLAAALKKLLDVETPLLTAAAAMRGTDGANTTTPPTTGEIKTALEAEGSHLTLVKVVTDKLGDMIVTV